MAESLGESPPAVVEEVPTEATATSGDRPVRERRRLRVPTSVAVTLLGIALTAWLLPAFTRQWDDRQKARDLKALINSQIANSTAKVLIASRQTMRFATAKKEPPPAREAERRRFRLEDMWFAESIEIEAKLRSHFDSPAVFRELAAYNLTMRMLFWVAAKPRLVMPFIRLQGNVGGVRAMSIPRLLGLSTNELGEAIRLLLSRDDLGVNRENGYRPILAGVLRREKALTDTIASAHANGYSTSADDLLRDLVP